jgi:hypothetical protein
LTGVLDPLQFRSLQAFASEAPPDTGGSRSFRRIDQRNSRLVISIFCARRLSFVEPAAERISRRGAFLVGGEEARAFKAFPKRVAFECERFDLVEVRSKF